MVTNVSWGGALVDTGWLIEQLIEFRRSLESESCEPLVELEMPAVLLLHDLCGVLGLTNDARSAPLWQMRQNLRLGPGDIIQRAEQLKVSANASDCAALAISPCVSFRASLAHGCTSAGYPREISI